MANNGDTQALQAIPVSESEDRIFQTLTSKKKTLEDVGLVKLVMTYVDNGVHVVKTHLIPHAVLDAIVNTVEDEAVA